MPAASRPNPESAMPSDPGELRIRNRRYRPWAEIVGLMWLILFMFVTMVWQGVAPSHKLRAYPLAACLLGGTVWCLRLWMLVLDLTERPLLGRREAARAAWNWVFRGIRPGDPHRVRVTIALALLGWLAPRRISVPSLMLGETVAFDPRYPVPAGEVRRVRFAPDPAEDYAELGGPVRYCAATVELSTGKEFCLILDEADAQRLREWATARGIAVSDCDGYCPRMAEPASEAPVHE